MPDSSNVSKQLHDYLPGMENLEPAPEKQPHEMTPDEFASHPYAVFHSTHLDHQDLFNPAKRFANAPVVHFGTEQAALDRHAITSSLKNRGLEARMDRNTLHTTDARLHTFWHKPESEDLPMGRDSMENDFTPGTRYYKNDYEDTGSYSLATSERNKLKSQHEYVSDAIAAGKSHEVHPATMDLYKRGLLQKGALLPLQYTKQFTTTAQHNYDTKLSIPKGERDSFNDLGEDANGTHSWFDESPMPHVPPVSTRGPDLDRIRAQVRKDSQK